MFNVFRELLSPNEQAHEMQVLTMSDPTCEFVKCITESCSRSLSNSLERFCKTKHGGQNSEAEHHFEIVPLDWENCTCWPEYQVELKSYKVHQQLEASHWWNASTHILHIRPEPFSEGAMRYAFPAFERREMKLVVKVYKYGEKRWRSAALLEKDAVSQAFARVVALEFSKRLPNTPLTFVRVQLMSVKGSLEAASHLQCATVEQYMPGEYKKHTNNSSFLAEGSEVAQAFSHFSWQFTGGKYMITDIQGINDSVMTDPQIHSSILGDDRFGPGNLGENGMDSFFVAHSCNAICHQLGLSSSPLQVNRDLACTDGLSHDDSCRIIIEDFESDGGAFARPSNLLCDGPCANMVCMSGNDYLSSMQTHGGVYCTACQEEIEHTLCRKPCANTTCKHRVVYSVFVLNITGQDAPMFCQECAQFADQGWSFCGTPAASDTEGADLSSNLHLED